MKIDEAGHISDMVVELLKQERIHRGISQYKLAKECGLCKTSIAFIERFENKPTLRTLLMISDCLQVDLGDVLKTVKKTTCRHPPAFNAKCFEAPFANGASFFRTNAKNGNK